MKMNFRILSSFNVNEMGSHWVLFLLYLNIVLNWPEDGRLRPKHVAKYNLIVIIASCLDVRCVLTVHKILYKKVRTVAYRLISYDSGNTFRNLFCLCLCVRIRWSSKAMHISFQRTASFCEINIKHSTHTPLNWKRRNKSRSTYRRFVCHNVLLWSMNQ